MIDVSSCRLVQTVSGNVHWRRSRFCESFQLPCFPFIDECQQRIRSAVLGTSRDVYGVQRVGISSLYGVDVDEFILSSVKLRGLSRTLSSIADCRGQPCLLNTTHCFLSRNPGQGSRGVELVAGEEIHNVTDYSSGAVDASEHFLSSDSIENDITVLTEVLLLR